uniref:3-keto-disaccharide hydrolase n=1 Tax=uncultured Draconibacterium sp. TaxID=1573823 RepID=UPI003217EF3C
MKVPSLFFLSAVLFVISCSTEQNVLTEAEKADGWTLLFDGETLNGWRDYNDTELTGPWIVEEGLIKAEGHGSDESGYIVTDKQYENFILTWDWKISQGGNSGMLYHVVENPKFKVPYVTGPEYQLIDNEGFEQPLEEWQKCGADYAMYLPDKSKLHINPVGDWNTSKIVFDNGHVEYWMNGEKTIEFEAWNDDWFERRNSGKWEDMPEYGLAHKGVFCLQDHGYPAWFRNIKIKELPKKTEKVELFNGVDLKGWEAYGEEKWYVEDGLLVCENSPEKGYGYLATTSYYDDFDLTVDFKQEANGNSGVFIRSFVEPVAKVNGWQVEVAPHGYGTGGIYESYGRGWLIQIPKEKEDHLITGDWNTLRIKVVGNDVQTWLNGYEMVKFSDEKIGKGQGRIALQIHDGGGIKVLWKKLKVTRL